jgi:hypothetical protein
MSRLEELETAIRVDVAAAQAMGWDIVRGETVVDYGRFLGEPVPPGKVGCCCPLGAVVVARKLRTAPAVDITHGGLALGLTAQEAVCFAEGFDSVDTNEPRPKDDELAPFYDLGKRLATEFTGP